MRVLLPLFACLMVVLTSFSSVAHAAEAVGGGVSAIEMAAWHAPDDADTVPGDADNGAVHHHSICHGHDLAAPVSAPAAPLSLRDAVKLRAVAAVAVMPRPVAAPHRPPIA